MRSPVRLLDDFARDLRYAVRLHLRNPGFTAVVLGTLGIAIGATVTVFSIADAWLFKPLRFPEADRLVVAFAARPERPREPAVWLPYRIYLGSKERSRSLESVSGAFVRDVTITRGADARTALGLGVTPEFFRTLGVRPFLGRTTSEQDATGARVVVLSHGFWQRYFGASERVIGTPISMSGVPHEIVGVMPRDFEVRVLDMRFEFWTPLRAGEGGYVPAGLGPIAVIGRLSDGVSIEAAQSELAAIMRTVESGHEPNFNGFVANLSSLQADNTRTVRTTLFTLLTAAACLLLITAINLGTLLLGRSLARTREVAIRAAIGCGRGRLIRQFLTECLVLAALGGAVGLVLATWGTRLFIARNPLGTLPANTIELDLRSLAAAGAAVIATILVAGLVPALRGSTVDPNHALRSGGERSASAPAQHAQIVMLVGQMAACVVLLIASALLTRTFVRLHTEPLGFDPADLYVANVILPKDPFDSREKRIAYFSRLADLLRGLPQVRAVAAGTSPPLHSGAPMSVNIGVEDAANAPRFSAQAVTPGFFDALRIPVIAGRGFDAADRADGSPVVILNARAARELFGRTDAAIGRRLRLDDEPWREVVGVIDNVRSSFFNTLEWKMDPIVYRPAAQAFDTLSNPTATSFGFHLYIRCDRPLAATEVRTVASAIGPAVVTDLRAIPGIVREATRQPALRMTLLLGFAALSVLLASVGIYGLVSQSVAQRSREIAIRLALGEEPGSVMWKTMRVALAAAVGGLLIGGIAALLAGHALEALIYGVGRGDLPSFAAAAVALLGATTLGALVPALRAVRVDPSRLLRTD